MKGSHIWPVEGDAEVCSMAESNRNHSSLSNVGMIEVSVRSQMS